MDYADPQVQAFVARSMIARIATVSAKGTPQLMPLFFVARGGLIYMNNAATSPTVRNIASNPDVVLLFDADRGRRRGSCLRVTGTARFVEGDALLRQMWLPGAVKYYLSLDAARDALRHISHLPAMRRYRGERRSASGVIEVTPLDAEFIAHPE
jgi:general stress protein 26